MDVPPGPITVTFKVFLAWVLQRVGYLWDISKNAAAFERGLKSLIQSRADAMIELDRAEVEGKLPRNEVVGWLGETEKAIGHGIKLLKDFHEGRRGCSVLRPSRYRLGKQIVESSQTVAELRERGKFDGYAVLRVPERVQPVPTATIRLQSSIQGATTGFQQPMAQEQDAEIATGMAGSSVAQMEGGSISDIFVEAGTSEQAQTSASNSGDTSKTSMEQRTSMGQTMMQIWDWLLDRGVMRIGIWGKGGIGKTTLMKNVINLKLYSTDHFDVVVFVTVSRDLNMKKLRQSIGKELSLDLSEEEDDRAARLLYNQLRRKKFFLILDDVWERIDLNKLGVPTAKNSSCKIALTTRKEVVCRLMETDKEIKVKDLPEDEAWELFCEKAGEVVSPYIEATARLVCKECHGLPLAIIVVGRALRKVNNKGEWEHALKVLKSSQFELEGMEDELFVPLKFSYDYLKNDTMRDCFLYCCLFPEDYAIDIYHLIDYWIMDGLIEEYENLNQASEKGQHYLLKELVESCLLERSSLWKETVKMHDVIRDMAIKITSASQEQGRRFLVNSGKGLHEWSGGNHLEHKDKISLMENDIRSLADEPNCPELSTLLLQGNDLRYIPESFFRHMKALRVLDLSSTMIKSLPQSMSELTRLRALILRDCYRLTCVNHVGGLKDLQLLDLRHTRIETLPNELQMLTQLRRLNLSCTYELQIIPAGAISRLSLLEDLDMKESSYFGGDQQKAEFFKEIGCLRHLNRLALDITTDLNATFLFEILGKLKNLTSCILRVGPPNPTFGSRYSKEQVEAGFSKRGRCLEFTHMSNLSHGAAKSVRNTEKLFLSSHTVLNTVSSLGGKNLENLRECWVSECCNLECVVNTEDVEMKIMPNLEILGLSDLQQLTSIWQGQRKQDSFKSIRIITIHNCPSVRYLFPSDVIHDLCCLEELKISACDEMVEIVQGYVGNGTASFPRLRCLVLSNLSSLWRLWFGVLSMGSLREIKVFNCRRLKNLPLVAYMAPRSRLRPDSSGQPAIPDVSDLSVHQEPMYDPELILARWLSKSVHIAPMLQIIEGQRKWWENLKWLDKESRLHFQSLFRAVDTPLS